MSSRPKDEILAAHFTSTQHSKATPSTDPVSNKFSQPLNVCVVGASRGIGAGIAYAFASAGASNLILAARASSSRELGLVADKAQALNPAIEVRTFAVDLTSSQSVAQLVSQIKTNVQKLDVVILNSGWSGVMVPRVEDGDPRDFQDVFDINVQGTYLIAHHFIPLLRESNGLKTFIAVGSFAACITTRVIGSTAYSVSKLAQTRLIECISEQYDKDGVLAVIVHPGAVNTEMANQAVPDSFHQYLTDDPGLCGAFLVWLCQEKRTWLNGRLLSATWDVDELLEKRRAIEEEDLLKFGLRLNTHSAAM